MHLVCNSKFAVSVVLCGLFDVVVSFHHPAVVANTVMQGLVGAPCQYLLSGKARSSHRKSSHWSVCVFFVIILFCRFAYESYHCAY